MRWFKARVVIVGLFIELAGLKREMCDWRG
jgi:hypothetical protein